MDDLLSEFLTETNESLEVLDQELIKLEQNPDDPELLSNIFRLMHTIKGTCGFLGLPRLEAVAHAGENVLGKLREGELQTSAATVSIILEALDKIREILSVLEATEAEPEGDDAGLIARLNAAAEGAGGEADAEAEPDLQVATETDEPVEEVLETVAELAKDGGEHPAGDESPVVEVQQALAPAPVASSDKAPASAAEETSRESSVANQSLRVNVEVLENLMTMVSELVLTRNQLLQILRTQKESDFAGPLQQLNHVVSELQDGVMQTRMQPIGNAWAKLPRIIRDLSLELGKKIDLNMKGADTELDRQVLELIKDPLTHMVRNSADHGLEGPGDRIAAGKPETGTVTLNAYHEGGHIIIEISDDGRGIAIEKVKQKVLANGLASESEIEGMTDQQIQQFIFKAGFSTAAAVTSVSGRGVGMDVVRTNIEKIGGTIELSSTEGKGSIFTIKIPLTLAIVSALIVECASERFAIPQLSVVELVRASANSEHTIEMIKDTPVLRLRSRLLPLVSLRDLLGLEEPETEQQEEVAKSGSDGFIVVAQVGTYTFGIIVDRVFDTEEIVVKPVAPILRNISLYSGNTILGDGSVVMILDPNGIAAATGEISFTDNNAEELSGRSSHTGAEQIAMLLFHAGDESPKAVPLALVARLEEVDCDNIESTNGRSVVQYRGQLMPLVSSTGEVQVTEGGKLPVLVFSDRGRNMGLVVDDIVDIVEDTMDVELADARPGFIGSAVIGGKATDIIDAAFYLRQAFPDWFNTPASEEANQKHKILLVDDSSFFRHLLAPLLQTAGYHVVTAESAEVALGLCEDGEAFDLIVSDIEMPEMDGFAFAQTVKQSGRWADVPILALSSHSGPNELARGREVGFIDYVAKDDRDGLLHSIQQTLTELRGAA